MTVNDIFKAAFGNKTIKVLHSRGETSFFIVQDVKIDIDDTLVFYPTEGAPKTFGPLHSLEFILAPTLRVETGGAEKMEKVEKVEKKKEK